MKVFRLNNFVFESFEISSKKCQYSLNSFTLFAENICKFDSSYIHISIVHFTAKNWLYRCVYWVCIEICNTAVKLH